LTPPAPPPPAPHPHRTHPPPTPLPPIHPNSVGPEPVLLRPRVLRLFSVHPCLRSREERPDPPQGRQLKGLSHESCLSPSSVFFGTNPGFGVLSNSRAPGRPAPSSPRFPLATSTLESLPLLCWSQPCGPFSLLYHASRRHTPMFSRKKFFLPYRLDILPFASPDEGIDFQRSIISQPSLGRLFPIHPNNPQFSPIPPRYFRTRLRHPPPRARVFFFLLRSFCSPGYRDPGTSCYVLPRC